MVFSIALIASVSMWSYVELQNIQLKKEELSQEKQLSEDEDSLRRYEQEQLNYREYKRNCKYETNKYNKWACEQN